MPDNKNDKTDKDEPRGPGHGPAARTPQEDHTPRQEEQERREAQQRQDQQRQRAQPSAESKAAADQQAAETKEAMAAASIGAQIILDYNSEASLGARGGMAGTIEENTMARDASLVAVGLDPVSPSGPPLGAPVEAPPDPPAARHQSASGQATRMSSLAAGALTGDREPPPPPPEAARAR
jgi:hypothetical protein